MAFVYKVAQILDRSTVTITGPVQHLSDGDDLLVLAIGPVVPGTDTRLVLPKAKLEVTSHAGSYVVARSRERTRTIERPAFHLMMGGSTTERVTEREKLNVDDKDLAGNPAAQPVRVGDVVITKYELQEYIAQLKQEDSARAEEPGK